MNILSDFITNMENSKRCWIELPKNEGGGRSASPILHITADVWETIEEKADHDEITAKFLYKKVMNLSDNPRSDEWQLALKAAEVFNKHTLARRTMGEKPMDEANSYAAKLQKTVRVKSMAEALKIPVNYLLNHPDATKFIETNILNYRIDRSYIDRGIGPKLVKDELYFPVNKGTAYNPDVVWTLWSDLPVDKHHKLKDAFGPFGFEPGVHATKPDKLFPIKLVDTPKEIQFNPGQVVVEMATSKTEKNLAGFVHKILKGGPGHSWIRVYEQQLDDSNKPTGKCFMYSFGVRTGLYHLCSPDVREFKNDVKFSAYLPLDKQKWESLKTNVEELQAAFLHKKEPTELPQILALAHHSLMNGTCVNFALYVFNHAHVAAYKKPIQVEGHTMFQTHLFSVLAKDPLYIPTAISSVLKAVTPDFVKAKVANILYGYMPWIVVDSLKEKQISDEGFITPEQK